MSKPVKTMVLWALLIMMFIAIWELLGTGPSPRTPASAPTASNAWQVTVSIAGTIFAVLYALRRWAMVAQKHNASILASATHLAAGRFDEAEQALGSALTSRLSQFRRAALVQRAEIALRRGDRDAILLRADEALAVPPGRLNFRGTRGGEASRADALALAALARASAGDEARTRADIEAVRAAPSAAPVALARAALAEVILLDRAGDRAALREVFDRHRALWLAACPQRERALVRAYEAMLDAGSAPVYRQKADRAESSERAALAEWVAKLAPNAAPFARSASPEPEGAREAAPDRPPTEEGKRKLEASRPQFKARNDSMKTLGLWVALVLTFVALWQIAVPWIAVGVVALGCMGLVGWIVAGIRRQRADRRRIDEGIRAYGVGDLDRAATALAFAPKNAFQRVQVAHFRADLALSQGRMAAALTEIDQALAALAEAQGGKIQAPVPAAAGVSAWDFPRVLAAQRSQALAVLGRFDEAWAELSWASGMPSELPRFRVRLIERLAVHDFEGAARLVEGRPADLGPAARDEALFDMIRFVARPASRHESEAARLRADLRRTVSLAPWVDAMAPGLSAAFEAAAAEGADGRQIAATP